MIRTADKLRRGLMGPNHVRRLERVYDLIDPTQVPSIQPTLDLDFTDIKGAPFAGNLTRATVGGYRMNAKGVMVPTVANEPVIDFNQAGTALGTGFYAAYTNLLLRSEEFDNAAWTKTEATITANAVVAPDGLTTADKIVESSNNADHSVRNTTGVVTGVASATFSVFVKSAERSQVKLTIYEGSNLATTGFDLTTATIISGAGKIEDHGNGWYRCSVTAAVVTGAVVLGFMMPMSGSVSTYLGNGTSGIYAWGAQLTATAFPVPYVPTTSAAVVRNLDAMVVSGTDFSDFFNQTEGTFFVNGFIPRGPTGASRIVQFDDLSDNNRHAIYFNSTTGLLITNTFVSGSATTSGFTTLTSPGAEFKAGFSYKINQFNFSHNGGSFTTDTSGAVPSTLSRFWLGFGEFNERIKRLIYWPKALTAAELQRMTA